MSSIKSTALSGGDFKQVALAALTGGAGGYLASGGLQQLTSGLSSALGFTPAAGAGAAGAAAPAAATGAGVSTSSLPAGFGVTPGASAGPSALSFGGSSDVVSAAINTGTGGTVQTLNTANNIAAGLNSSGQALTKALTQLAGIAFGAQTTDELNAAQQAYLQQLAQQARQNQEVFAQKLAIAQQLRQQGEPNFEKAFADAQMQLRTQEREAQRRLATSGAGEAARAALERQYATERARVGVTAAAKESERAQSALQAAAGLYPTAPSAKDTPQYAELSFEREQQARADSRLKDVMGVAGKFYDEMYGDNKKQKAGVKPPPGTIVTTTTPPPQTRPAQTQPSIYDADIFSNMYDLNSA